MSTTIDQRVVEMQFRDSGFVSGVSKYIDALTKLKAGLNLKSAQDSLNQLDDAGKRFSLSNLASAAEGVGSKFSALGVIGVTALATIASKAVSAGLDLVKSFTIQPILDGLSNYETKINAIQTILANTQSQGTNLTQVTAALDELNKYANLTVYNFADMTKNIGTFTAAGVSLQTSVSSIKGIANLAALSGSSSEQASTAMYQLSQAIASGSVKLQDWNSVVNAGFGGKVFQNALIQTAAVHDKSVTSMIQKEGGFRQSLQSGWLTAKVLTDTLNTFTGDMSKNQLVAYGYTSKEADAIIAQAKAAVNSATQIRTVSQLMQALKEEVGSAWAKVWEALIGNINQATGTLSVVHNVLETLFTTPILNLAKFLEQWNQLGGRAAVIDGIANAFKALGAIFGAIKDAFNNVFPAASVSAAVALSLAFQRLTQAMIPSKQTVNEVRDVFTDLFSAVKIVVDIVGDVVKGFTGVASGAGGAASGILGLVGKVTIYLQYLLQIVEGNTKLKTALGDVGKVLASPIALLSNLTNVFGFLGNAVSAAYSKIQPFLHEVGAEFGKLSSAIASSIQSGGFANVENVINQGLFGAILLAIRKFISNLGKSGEESKGLFATIKESFESLTSTLGQMQATLKSEQLRNIAISIGILAASVIALSFVNVPNLVKALSAMSVMFTELVVSLGVITKISGSVGIIKLPIIAASLILLSIAIVILAGAVAILSRFSWEELAKGLSAIAVLLGLLAGTLLLLSKNTAGVYASAAAMELVAVAMNIMSIAVGRLGAMDWGTLLKGVGTIAVLLLVIAGFNAISGDGAGLIGTAAAMVIMGAALLIMSQAIQAIGSLPVATLAQGLIGITVALLIMAGAMALMEGSLPGAAALVIASAALVILASALTTLGGLSWTELAIALIALAGSLVLIAAALIVMEASLPGAAALIVAAAALAILAPVMVILGSLSWEAIAKGLAALAGVLVIIGVAGLLLIPAIPGLLGLGAAIALIGVGILAAGAGVALFGTGLVLLAAGLAALGVAIAAFVSAVLGLLPQLTATFTGVITSFATGIAKAGPAIINALSVVLQALLNAIIKNAPLLTKAFNTIIADILQILATNAPKIVSTLATMLVNMLVALTGKVPAFVSAGVSLIIAILNGIAANVAKVVAAATNIAISFINAIGAAGLRITQAGATMIINFVNGLAKQINADAPQMRAAGLNLAEAIVNGMTGGILNGIPSVTSAARSIASTALSAAKSLLGINSPSKEFQYVGEGTGEGMVIGMNNMVNAVADASGNMGSKALDAIKTSLAGVSDAVNSNIELQPKITPVLDLTQAQAGFSTLAGMTKDQLLNANTSLVKATSISANNAQTASAIGATDVKAAPTLQFTQYNTSPKALSSAEIYRQTKNQLSVVKEALPS